MYFNCAEKLSTINQLHKTGTMKYHIDYLLPSAIYLKKLSSDPNNDGLFKSVYP